MDNSRGIITQDLPTGLAKQVPLTQPLQELPPLVIDKMAHVSYIYYSVVGQSFPVSGMLFSPADR